MLQHALCHPEMLLDRFRIRSDLALIDAGLGRPQWWRTAPWRETATGTLLWQGFSIAMSVHQGYPYQLFAWRMCTGVISIVIKVKSLELPSYSWSFDIFSLTTFDHLLANLFGAKFWSWLFFPVFNACWEKPFTCTMFGCLSSGII